jgi:hypothetical protein
MTAILSTFLPSVIKAQYWFINGNQDYFELEDLFIFPDFVYINLHNPHYVEQEITKSYEFLARIDDKGAQWLLCIPSSPIVKIIFSNYNQHSYLDPDSGVDLLAITNYSIKT